MFGLFGQDGDAETGDGLAAARSAGMTLHQALLGDNPQSSWRSDGAGPREPTAAQEIDICLSPGEKEAVPQKTPKAAKNRPRLGFKSLPMKKTTARD